MLTVAPIYFAGGATDKNGDIYASPVKCDCILKITFDFNGNIPENLYKTFFIDNY